MIPLMPSPGSPKIASTPQAWMVSISKSEAVKVIAILTRMDRGACFRVSRLHRADANIPLDVFQVRQRQNHSRCGGQIAEQLHCFHG